MERCLGWTFTILFWVTGVASRLSTDLYIHVHVAIIV